ncbi:MAG: carboxypeptidase-like regulatory domain-containing protein, partial [Prevotellaceae bacterium]|nr:carboxypeptidase-like regulatory domain-containing protein [Prevotellaceae bacterium]
MTTKAKQFFNVTGRRISFLRKVVLLSCLVAGSITYATAQDRMISGIVTDADNVSLAGVIVRVQGSVSAVTTDASGNYTIPAKPGDVLEFSFIGMQSQQVTVGTSGRIDVVMEEEAT